MKRQLWDDAISDCLKAIEINGPNKQNHKAFFFLAQAQLALHHPNEATSSAITAYDQVRNPLSAAKISPKDLETFSAFVLKCKKARFAARDRERRLRQHDLRAELEDTIEANKRQELDQISEQLGNGALGQVEASERKEEVHSNAKQKVQDVQALFAVVDPANQKLREIPDHLVDMITFEVMHDPVITKNGHSYERATLYEHLKRSPTDPLTRDPLTINDLRNNFGLKAACDEFWESGASEWIHDW